MAIDSVPKALECSEEFQIWGCSLRKNDAKSMIDFRSCSIF